MTWKGEEFINLHLKFALMTKYWIPGFWKPDLL